MNENQPPPQPQSTRMIPPLPKYSPPQEPPPRTLVLEEMTGSPGLGGAMEALLKRPGSAVREFMDGKRPGALAFSLILIALGGLALFGVAAMDFSKPTQWWAGPLKMIAGLALSGLLCLPSLYIFGCLSGLEIRLKTAAGLLLTSLSLSGLLLAGFTPVVWVFSQSTGSLVFLGAILVLLWVVALYLGMKTLTAGARALGMTSSLHLRIWVIMFGLVTLQMTCALRPLLGQAETFLPTEKKFFLEHWVDNMKPKDYAGPILYQDGESRPSSAR